MIVDREALKAKAEAIVEHRRLMSPRATAGLADELARGALSLLAEVQAAEATVDRAVVIINEIGDLRAERDQLAAEVERLRAALVAVAESRFSTEPQRIARDALGEEVSS